jgi:putative two-component system response regulator
MSAKPKKTIFVVDDVDTTLSMANELLKEQYEVMTVPSAVKMFALLKRVTPDLILLDIEMPEMDGLEAIRRLKNDGEYADIPVIFLTVVSNNSVEALGFLLGAIDFITKPFSGPVLLNRIKAHLDIDGIIRERTLQLQRETEKLLQKTTQVQCLHNAIIFGFADLLESRDEGTGGHIDRTAAYIKVLMDAMAAQDVYSAETEKLDLEQFVSSSRLHDVGKIVISDMILNKPDKLTDEEYEIMKTHSAEGERIIDKMASRTNDVDFLYNAKLFAGCHHERWDGKGYPRGLAGTDIPLQGRVMAIVDAYDAIVSERPYKQAFPPEKAVAIIMEDAGKHFDPVIADVFFKVQKEFQEIIKTTSSVR